MLATMMRCGLAEAARAAGFDLSAWEIEEISWAEEACLVESGRVCFGEGASVRIARALSGSPYLEGDAAGALASLIEAFYEIREDTPAQVTDQEIAEALREHFDGEAAGEVGLALALAREGLSASDSLLAYEIADEDGRVYRWDPDEWFDDVEADGWCGERWDGDYE